jgi:A/G-specific adenine glycosylase
MTTQKTDRPLAQFTPAQPLDGMQWPDARWKQQLRRRLKNWFARHARDLPWRQTRDLYRIWVSEVMLQQTQVATVIPYYDAFLRTFPTLTALAAARQHEVLRCWEGLGYYRRARQLHEAARRVVAEHRGKMPEDIDLLKRLPGIGRYTAGAILSIGRDQRQPILEANTLRLFSRLIAYQDDPRSADGQRTLWDFALRILPRRDVGRFNQALMELGSEICTPRQPRCDACPVSTLCPTHRHGLQGQIPVPARRPVYEDLHELAVVVWRGDRILLRQCRETERWAGLWDFPRFPIQLGSEVPVERQLVEGTLRLTGIEVRPGTRLMRLKHGVTRYRITLDCYQAEYQRTRQAALPGELGRMDWIFATAVDQYPLSVTGRKLSRLLTTRDDVSPK